MGRVDGRVASGGALAPELPLAARVTFVLGAYQLLFFQKHAPTRCILCAPVQCVIVCVCVCVYQKPVATVLATEGV